MAGKRYAVVVTPHARKSLLRLPDKMATRLEEAMLALEENPRPPGCKKLKGRDAYRIRVGDYRVIYELQDHILRVIVIDIGHRKDIY